MRNILLPVLVGFLLVGCQFAPEHQRPMLPTNQQYPASLQPGQGELIASEVSWNRFFLDPRLRLLIDTALEHNRDMQIAVARIEEARGQFRVRDADRYPTLALGASAVRSRSAIPSAGAGASGTGGSAAPAAGLSGGGVTERYTVEVGVAAFELDFWGRVRNLAEGARAEYLATLEAQRAFQLSLVGDVAATYLSVRGAEQRMQLAQSTVANRRDEVRISRVRLDAGIASALEYNQAEALLAQAQTQLAELRLTVAQQQNYLTLLTGAATSSPLPEPYPLDRQLPASALAAGLPSELLYSRPDIIAAEERLRAARANIGVARAAFFPSISLTGNAGYASGELDGLISGDNKFWSIGPSVTLPIFDFGGRDANLTVAQARENIAIAEYERTIQAAFREVADALAGRRYLAEQLALQEDNVATLGNIAELARDRYDEGVVNFLQVLDAERTLFEAEQALVQIQRAKMENLVALYIALGGGAGTVATDSQ
ncbi:efflux transporter outer membrane subunit [Halopseudomonas salina]|uniref:AdeC/adeK/oprM family multidrug efflux complex outer membrane factor n=1 Tax=Halopseudomonas salina TaxID=1323744 RepID=A0ABQ1NZ16_9GAMM|nr:efflux transporter outer membrane subunit [Halopseudomonas salina]GGC87680.1 adeC/adeK/oprM family multidrug efflux complex outer membrane factor [Halopseudomonas salina]